MRELNREKKGRSERKDEVVITHIAVREWFRIICSGLGIGLFAVWICYDSWKALPAAVPIAVFFGVLAYRAAVEKNRQLVRLHFRDFLTAVHIAVRSGYSLENAVRSGCRDTALLYGKSDLLVRELEHLIRQMEYRVPVEKLFRELGNTTGIREIQSFAEMITITKRTGGNLGKVLGDSWRILNRRMDTEMEIETLMTAKKYEQSVMSVMPAGMILYLRFTFPGFVDHLYGDVVGILIMTIALVCYLAAFALGRRIVRIEV